MADKPETEREHLTTAEISEQLPAVLERARKARDRSRKLTAQINNQPIAKEPDV